MKISRLLAVVLTLGFMAGPAVAGIVTNGLIGAHDAGVGWDGTNLNDANIGDGYDAVGTPTGGVTHTAASGSDPAYFSFAGTHDRINLDALPHALGTGDFTVQMWVNMTSGSEQWQHTGFLGNSLASGDTYGFALGMLRGSAGKGLLAWTMSSPADEHTAGWPPSDYQQSTTGNQETPLTDGTWHQMTVVREAVGASSGLRLWMDETEITGSGDQLGDTVDMGLATFAMDINGPYGTVGGRMKSGDKFNKLLVYNRALSQSEIEQNLNAGAAATVPEPASLTLLGIGAALVLLRRRRA